MNGTNPVSKEMLLLYVRFGTYLTSVCLARKGLPPEPEIGLIPGTLFPPPTVDIISLLLPRPYLDSPPLRSLHVWPALSIPQYASGITLTPQLLTFPDLTGSLRLKRFKGGILAFKLTCLRSMCRILYQHSCWAISIPY